MPPDAVGCDILVKTTTKGNIKTTVTTKTYKL